MVDKVLEKKLGVIMDKLISPNLSPFIKGRILVNGFMVVNEEINFAKNSRRPCLIFKIDSEKAYDLVNWSILNYMLIRFGFNDKWRAWIRVCVISGNLVLLVMDH